MKGTTTGVRMITKSELEADIFFDAVKQALPPIFACHSLTKFVGWAYKFSNYRQSNESRGCTSWDTIRQNCGFFSRHFR